MENQGKHKERQTATEQQLPAVKWELTEEDRVFLKSCNISPE